MDIIVQVIISICASIPFPIVLFFLFREWISTRIRKSIQHEYDKKIEEFKAIQQKELEGYKAGYQKFLDENRVRFNWWHEEQAKAIKEFYANLAELRHDLAQIIEPFNVLPVDVVEKNKILTVQLQAVASSYNKCVHCWDRNSIFFKKDFDKSVGELFSKYIEAFSDCEESLNSHTPKARVHAWITEVKEISPLLDKLRDSFQELLQGEGKNVS